MAQNTVMKQIAQAIEFYYQDPEAWSDEEIRVIKNAADAAGIPFTPRSDSARMMKNLGFNLLDTALLGALPEEWAPEAFTANERGMGTIGDVLGMVVPGTAAFKFGKWLMPTGKAALAGERGAISRMGRAMSQAERGLGREAVGRGGVFGGVKSRATRMAAMPKAEPNPWAFTSPYETMGGVREAAKGISTRAASAFGGKQQQRIINLMQKIRSIKNPTLRAAYRTMLMGAYKGIPYAERAAGMGAGAARAGLGVLENAPRATRWGATGLGFLGLHNMMEAQDDYEYDPYMTMGQYDSMDPYAEQGYY